MAVKKKYNIGSKGSALGRGLDALISTEALQTEGSSTINEIPLQEIHANPNQPRREFDQVALQELADSIREIGIIQPITLHQVGPQEYMIIAGERRWRASQLAGLTTIPAYVRTLSDASIMEMALVENIQREDLNVIEVALAYQQLMDKEKMTQDKVAQRVGKSRAAVANTLRLLRLPAQVQMALQKRNIDMGHARALLSLESPTLQVKVFRDILKHDYSVRRVEEIVQTLKNGGEQKEKPIKILKQLPKEVSIMRDKLSKHLKTPVDISLNAQGKGKLTISFKDLEQLKKLIENL